MIKRLLGFNASNTITLNTIPGNHPVYVDHSMKIPTEHDMVVIIFTNYACKFTRLLFNYMVVTQRRVFKTKSLIRIPRGKEGVKEKGSQSVELFELIV